MLEQQRLEYLQAMGIQLWMPRRPVPNAVDSLWIACDEPALSKAQTSGEQIKAGQAAELLVDMSLVTDPSDKTTSAQVTAKSINQTSTQLVQDSAVDDVKRMPENTDDNVPFDLTVPEFELHFALWPCGILWVASQAFDYKDQSFQTSVSYSMLGGTLPQASYSQFKWPYIEGSSEDQSITVALRALTVQWEFMSNQGARAWVAVDASSFDWLSKVAVKPLYSVDDKSRLFSITGKKQLWRALLSLPKKVAS
jgi:hypothetical protein